MRRFLIIIATVIVLLGLGIVAYFYFFPGGPPSVVVAPTRTTSLPAAGETPTGTTTATVSFTTSVTTSGRLTQISSGPIVPGEIVVDRKAVNASSSAEVAVTYIE